MFLLKRFVASKCESTSYAVDHVFGTGRSETDLSVEDRKTSTEKCMKRHGQRSDLTGHERAEAGVQAGKKKRLESWQRGPFLFETRGEGIRGDLGLSRADHELVTFRRKRLLQASILRAQVRGPFLAFAGACNLVRGCMPCSFYHYGSLSAPSTPRDQAEVSNHGKESPASDPATLSKRVSRKLTHMARGISVWKLRISPGTAQARVPRVRGEALYLSHFHTILQKTSFSSSHRPCMHRLESVTKQLGNTISTMAPQQEQFIGSIDQGTTSTRFLIFNTSGEPVATHQIEFKQIYPQPG